ncbi:acylphosphatase [Candidatus Latescibacterota bacterium]
MSINAVNIIVHGRVQGVGFRFFVREKAKIFGMKGWVRNCSDGTVEIHSEGEDELLTDFITEIEKGPVFGNVSGLTVNRITPVGTFSGFNIKF